MSEYKGSPRFELFCAGLTSVGADLDFAEGTHEPEDAGDEPAMEVIGFNLNVNFYDKAIRLSFGDEEHGYTQTFEDDGEVDKDGNQMHVLHAIYFARGFMAAHDLRNEEEED